MCVSKSYDSISRQDKRGGYLRIAHLRRIRPTKFRIPAHEGIAFRMGVHIPLLGYAVRLFPKHLTTKLGSGIFYNACVNFWGIGR